MRGAVVGFAALLALSACADPNAPHLGVGLGFGPNGVRVTPRVTTRVGDTSVGVSPYGTSVGTTVGNVGIGASL